MPAVQQGRDFVEKEGVEVAHMGAALAGQAVLSGGGLGQTNQMLATISARLL
jgi:hypothetical protein